MHRYLRRVRVLWPAIVSRDPNALMREADVYVLPVVRLQRPAPPTERLVCVKYAQLFVSFFIGGVLLYSIASLLACGNDDGKFGFFIMQFVAIFIEDHVINFSKCIEAKENRAWRVLGYL